MSEQTILENMPDVEVDPEADKLFNLRSASAYTGVGATAIRYWILTGKVPAEMKNGQWQIRKADLDVQNAKSKEFAGGVLRGPRGKITRITPADGAPEGGGEAGSTVSAEEAPPAAEADPAGA